MTRELQLGGGAIFLTESALSSAPPEGLARLLRGQPGWSDIPVLLLADHGDSPLTAWAVETLGSLTVLERPVRTVTAVTALRSALKARQRQYELRNHLQAQGWLAAVVASSDDAIISKTLEGVMTTWNAGAERLFGYSTAEAIGRPITLLIPEERREEESLILQRLRRGERIEHFETVRVTKEGHQLDVSLTLSPVLDSYGGIMGISTVARDITARRREEEARREADRRKDVFLATLAHELRNPLAPIRNAVHILRLASEHDTIPQHLIPIIERQVGHLARLVDDLMEVSRISHGKIELRRERVDLADVVRSALETSRPLIEAGRHELAVTLPSEPVQLFADPVRLTQVIANLLNNAAKFTPDGGRISLSARVEGTAAVITVRDTGIGMSPDLLGSVFDLFIQGERPAQRQTGLGIGLTLVRSLVQLHGGTVEARSEGPGLGSEFILRLPSLRLPGREGPAPESLERSGADPPTGSRRILVVDDSRDAADSLAELLRLMGYEVQLAYEGLTALEAARQYRPDVAVLDLAMPGMDGFELARQLRRVPTGNRMRLIALTGYGQEEFRRRSREAGFDAHFVKPADPGALQAVLTAS
ncbi:MAG TPA: PAS domain S-box protein [Gemmatimonadales bacterium]